MTNTAGSNVCFTKVIKGEIHNILSLLRQVPKYDSRVTFSNHYTLAPFDEPNQRMYSSSTFAFVEDDSQSHTYLGKHPLLSSLRQLHEYLNNYYSVEHYEHRNRLIRSSSLSLVQLSNSWQTTNSSTVQSSFHSRVSSVTFLAPFCTAVASKDISAIVTAAALSAIHKFLLYGFIDPIHVNDAMEGITLIARAIRHCSFTEEEDATHTRNNSTRQQQQRMTQSKTNTAYPKHDGRSSPSIASLITDEQVVLKLLSLASLVVRSTVGQQLLDSNDTVGIFETVLHVALCNSQKASSLLRSAAGDCLTTIVLVVFGNCSFQHKKSIPHHDLETDSDSDSRGSDDIWGDMDPSEHLDDTHVRVNGDNSVKNSNPLETKETAIPTNHEVGKTTSLLPTSTTTHRRDDSSSSPALITIMSRIVSLCNPITSDDERCILGLQLVNIALETASPDHLTQYHELLHVLQNDLCKHLLLLSTTIDLVVLTQTLRVIFNLFNSIKNHLKIQLEVFITSVHLRMLDPKRSGALFSYAQREIALESLLEFCNEPELMMNLFLNYDCDVNSTNLFDSICKVFVNVANDGCDVPTSDVLGLIQACDRVMNMNPKPLNSLNQLAAHGLMSIIDSIAKRSPVQHKYDASRLSQSIDRDTDLGKENDIEDADSTCTPFNDTRISDESSQLHTAVLVQSKLQKERLSIIAEQFNRKSTGKEWIQTAQDWDILPTPITPNAVAMFLFTTTFLDKAQIGLYLSRGPHEKFPFNALVLREFTALYDFAALSFSDALRLFLHHFRLPGEAQCIDRLMEAFAKQYFISLCETIDSQNNQISSNEDLRLADDAQSPIMHTQPIKDDLYFPFKSADAVYILSFSTIMLNTDLHNSTITDNRKMTADQFVRNNRGINDGEDFPERFVVGLYHEIQSRQIQVHQSIDLFKDGHLLLDGLFRRSDLSASLFTSYYDLSNRPSVLAGVHERDMFVFISDSVFPTLLITFARSQDAQFSMKVLRALKDMALVSIYFSFQDVFDKILSTLLSYSHNYILSTLTPNVAAPSDNIIRHTSSSEKASLNPECLLTKGLICLDMVFYLSRLCPELMNQSWSILVDLLLTLHDFNCLPLHICELEDFSDSKDSLSPSQYCKDAHHRAYLFLSENLDRVKENDTGIFVGSLSSMFHSAKNSPAVKKGQAFYVSSPVVSSDQAAILSIIISCQIEQLLIGKQNKCVVQKSIAALLTVTTNFESYDTNECSGLFEHHAVFALELASRSLFSNREHSSQLYPLIYTKFEEILSDLTMNVTEENVVHPYLVERIVITILRSCIHMFDEEAIRSILLSSLRLLSPLPSSYLDRIANRVGCAFGILLRVSVGTILNLDEWMFIGNWLDRISRLSNGKAFIFHGISTCVNDCIISCDGQGPPLCKDGAVVLFKLLVNYIDGVYGEISYLQDAILYLDAIYFYIAQIDNDARAISSGDQLWLQMSKTVWKRVFHDESIVAKTALDALQKLLFSSLESHSDDALLTMLDMLTARLLPLSNQDLRINFFDLLCTVMLSLVPSLSRSVANHAPLGDYVRSVAKCSRENLRAGRNGTVTRLFETTLERITNIINVLTVTLADDDFCGWCVDLLYNELEQVGAGGSLYMTLHTRRKCSYINL